jgi:hypothetical protein
MGGRQSCESQMMDKFVDDLATIFREDGGLRLINRKHR